VFGPPNDPDAGVAGLHEVVELGITHIDTSDYYGPQSDTLEAMGNRLGATAMGVALAWLLQRSSSPAPRR
jgi:aryl-alcohol dehydrogenase-like predicted oxidoreductase